MKKIFSVICFLFFCHYSLAEEIPSVVVQLKYAPWGLIDADEEDFNYFSSSDDSDFQKYDMHFDRSIGARVIIAPFYIAANRSTTNIDKEVPDAIVETLSIGMGAANMNLNDYNTYLIGALGVGKGRFKFKDPNMNDWEYFMDANAELGFDIEDHILIGLGVDWQLFGKPGETKANYWNLYLGTGFSF